MSHTEPTGVVSREYILGTDESEFARLGLQHCLWSEQAFSIWERAGFGPGSVVLDAGCGPGFATLDLAALTGPSGRVIAVDESARFVDRLKARQLARGLMNIEAIVADVQRLELDEGSVDFAYARWVLCFLKDPEAAVAGVARALRTGGVFAVQDYFNYRAITLAPRSEAFDRVVRATEQSWRESGGDPDVAGRLPAMMARHGLKVREVRPILRVARPGSLLWQWPETFFRTYMARLVERNFLSPDDVRSFQTDLEARSKDPAGFFQTPPVFDLIAVKE